MSPDERAKAAVDQICYCDSELRRAIGENGVSIIASAIREAEASARNEALEEAAVLLEQGLTDVRRNRGSGTTSSPWAASVVRNLKTKD